MQLLANNSKKFEGWILHLIYAWKLEFQVLHIQAIGDAAYSVSSSDKALSKDSLRICWKHWFGANGMKELVMFVDDCLCRNEAKIYCALTKCFIVMTYGSNKVSGHFDLKIDASDSDVYWMIMTKPAFAQKFCTILISRRRKKIRGGEEGE